MQSEVTQITKAVVIGLVTHAVFLLSIYDIYYTTSVFHGMTPHKSRYAPAKRLFFIALDGVRASSVFQLDNNNKSAFPFTRNIVETKGAWGVANNEKSTFTNAAHIAMTSGKYEDLPELLKREAMNGVHVDTVYNESREIWSWGDRRIFVHLNVEKNAVNFDDHITTNNVVNITRRFIQLAREDLELRNRLEHDKICLCLQVGHTDHLGHLYHQDTLEYKEKVGVVEDHIRQIVEMFDDFTGNDGKTAYILTSDHGQGVQHQHGTDTPLERFVPFVTWGAGIRGPVRSIDKQTHDQDSQEWKLADLVRHDIKMTQMAPLMASLIGVNFPMNSEAVLPHEFLNVSDQERADMVCAASRQLLAHMERIMLLKKAHYIAATFQYFRPLGAYNADDLYRDIAKLLATNNYRAAVERCDSISHMAVEGITYYTNYDRCFLRFIVILGFVGWLVYISTFLNGEPNTNGQLLTNFISMLACAVTFIYLYTMELPWRYFVYCSATILVWNVVYCRTTNIQIWKRVKSVIQRYNYKTIAFSGLAWMMLITFMVHGTTARFNLSAGFIIVGVSYILYSDWGNGKGLRLAWLVLCTLAAVFPVIPVIAWPPPDLNRGYLVMTGALACVASLVFIWHKWNIKSSEDVGTIIVNLVQIVIICISSGLAYSTRYVSRYREHIEIPAVVHSISWIIIDLSPLWPMLVTVSPGRRLFTVVLSLLPVMILSSISWDSVYLLCMCLLLYTWYLAETRSTEAKTLSILLCEKHLVDHANNNTTTMSTPTDSNGGHTDLRNIWRVFYAIFFIFASIFGKSSIVSIIIFYRARMTFCLTENASSNEGLFIIAIQILLPTILIACTVKAIHTKVPFSVKQALITACVISDILAMNFLFQFNDMDYFYKSLASIFHYAVATFFVIILLLLAAIAHVLMSIRIQSFVTFLKALISCITAALTSRYF